MICFARYVVYTNEHRPGKDEIQDEENIPELVYLYNEKFEAEQKAMEEMLQSGKGQACLRYDPVILGLHSDRNMMAAQL